MTTFHTYLARCCRTWPMALGFPIGRCGVRGEVPVYQGPDADCSCAECVGP